MEKNNNNSKKLKMKTCDNCGKELKRKSNTARFCDNNCNHQYHYFNNSKNKERIKKNARNSYWRNREKVIEKKKPYFKKYLAKNREWYNKIMRESYRKHKKEWDGRSMTYAVISGKDRKYKYPIDNYCKRCKSKERLMLHFEKIPGSSKQARQLIDEGLIYYLCSKCKKNIRRENE